MSAKRSLVVLTYKKAKRDISYILWPKEPHFMVLIVYGLIRLFVSYISSQIQHKSIIQLQPLSTYLQFIIVTYEQCTVS